MTRVAISDEDVAKIRSGKPVAKGKKKRGASPDSTPENSNAEKVKRESTDVVRSTVSAAQVKGVMYETVWRVQREMTPGLPDTELARLNSDEAGYCILLTMMYGVAAPQMKKGLRIREHSYKEAPDCGAHDE